MATVLYFSGLHGQCEARTLYKNGDFESYKGMLPTHYNLGGGKSLDPEMVDRFNQNGGRPYGRFYSKPW